MFTGAYTALITPFKNGKIDQEKFEQLVEWQISKNIDGLVPVGTTGESPTLSIKEHNDLIKTCCDVNNKRVKVIAGVGSNSTEEALRMSVHANEVGADGLLLVLPYYNRPSFEGVFQHFKTINDNVNIPIIVYNVPTRVGIDINSEELGKLFELSNVSGLKDATGNISRIYNDLVTVSNVKSEYSFLSGNDDTAIHYNLSGGQGIISVISNLMPREVSKIQELCLNGEFQEAIKLHYDIMEIINALSCETNPIAIKYAMHLIGKCDLEYRLPLVEPSDYNKQLIKNALTDYSIL